MESHLREQGFYVVASGVISNQTKIYVCARGIGVLPLFFAELVRARCLWTPLQLVEIVCY